MLDFLQQRADRARPEGRLLSLPIELVVPNPSQPRKQFAPGSLEELAASITEYGLMQPVVVRWNGKQYELIAGERRWRACQMAGLTRIDALISEADSEQSACMALVENIQRENLHFFEEAYSYLTLMQVYNITQEELASRIGKNQSTVANKLRVMRLSESVKSAILEARLTERHARALLKLPSDEEKLAVIVKVRTKMLSVKETERLVDQTLEKEKRDKPGPKLVRLVKDYRLFVNTMKSAFKELTNAGVDAHFDLQEDDEQVFVTVAIPKRPVMSK